MGDASSTPQGGRRRAASARFVSPRLPLLLLVLKGWALTVVTVGAYRFWAVADLRSFLWRHLSLAGERFEFDGRPAEALIRFLIEAAIAIPVLAGLLFGLLALRGADPIIGAGGVALSAVVATYLVQIRRYRTRQYLLSHTLWRGIRGGMDGSAPVFAAIATAGWLGVVASLGLAYPWMRTRCWSYQIGRARFGDKRFRFAPSGGAPFGAWLVVWLGIVGVLILFVGLNQDGLLAIADGWRAGFPADPGPPLTLAPFALLILPAILAVRYRVREFRFVAASVRFGPIDLESRLPTVSIVLAALLHWVLVLVGLGLALQWLNRSAAEAALVMESVGTVMPLALAALTVAFVSAVKTVWLRLTVIRTVCRTLLVGDVSALQAVEQYVDPRARRVRRTGAARAAALAADEA